MKLPPLKLDAVTRMLGEAVGRTFTISGNADGCMMVDSNFVDVLQSGFVPQDELVKRATSALFFWQLGPKKAVWQTSNTEDAAGSSTEPLVLDSPVAQSKT